MESGGHVLMSDYTELGHGHSYMFLVADSRSHPTDDERFLNWHEGTNTLVGIVEIHKDNQGDICGGMVTFVRGTDKPERPLWDVEKLEPLTINPSIQCTKCGSHGFIRQGRWVDA